MPIKVNDPLTLFVWSRQETRDGFMVVVNYRGIGSERPYAAYHHRCVRPYADMESTKRLLELYDFTLYTEGEFLPPVFTRCSRCEGEFPRPPKRKR